MPEKPISEFFDDAPPEWTSRKHQMLRSYVWPAVNKLKTFGKGVALVDGYAGANQYGSIQAGSTLILAEAAKKLVEAGTGAKVFACEAYEPHYKQLVETVSSAGYSEVVETFPTSHSASVATIKAKTLGSPAVVFLDPKNVSQLSLDKDLRPWLERSRTDVLGLFHCTQVVRVCAAGRSPKSSRGNREAAARIVGSDWESIHTEDDACTAFIDKVKPFGKLCGLYKLRKLEPKVTAYAIFGISESHHGLALFSDYIARDFGRVLERDRAQGERSLFESVEEEDAISTLANMINPILQVNPNAKAKELMLEAHRLPEYRLHVFGAYRESDYTKAKRQVQMRGIGG